MRIKPLVRSLPVLVILSASASAQKKPLDHTVYDSWEKIDERIISNDGNYNAYTVTPQQGDGHLVICRADGGNILKAGRGFQASFSKDSRFAIFKIKPFYTDWRNARIQKKGPAAMPRDSLGIVNLRTAALVKLPFVLSYKLADSTGRWLAYMQEKEKPEKAVNGKTDSAAMIKNLIQRADSLRQLSDSLRRQAGDIQVKGLMAARPSVKEKKAANSQQPELAKEEKGNTLILRDLQQEESRRFDNITDYEFDKQGNALILVTAPPKGATMDSRFIIWYHLATGRSDTLMRRFYEARSLVSDEGGKQLAFLAARDSSLKSIHQYYTLWYYQPGSDSAVMLADNHHKDLPEMYKISENGGVRFSKSGRALYFELALQLPDKDTSLPEFERVSVDVWNYRDKELQTIQLANLNKDLRKTYTARYDRQNNRIIPLSDDTLQLLPLTNEGDGSMFYGTVSTHTAEAQWEGYSPINIYAVDPLTGKKQLVEAGFRGSLYPSATGRYLLLLNRNTQTGSVYNARTGLTTQIALAEALFQEDNDVPDAPHPYGIMGWLKGDRYVYLYDRYDIFQVDPEGREKPVPLTYGRKLKKVTRYERTDMEEKAIDPENLQYFKWYSEISKKTGYEYGFIPYNDRLNLSSLTEEGPYFFTGLKKARNADACIYTRENYEQSPQLYRVDTGSPARQLSDINKQQAQYLWGSAELYKWTAYTGKTAEGILYKPEHFNPKKKYPLLLYFYERNNEKLYQYISPQPTPSKLNISFFVSRGYVVFMPDVWYTTGHPGQGAFDYIVSGTRALIKEGFIDSARIGIQGQSWGGYQVAHLITRTNLYKAAWAGAPVANMFSAYGGIRWESGRTRQFQYEKTQSRIGATIWEKPALYIENSPLFHLPRVTTPLVIMSNDADGAVPWYQGIELFTALRRLNKPVWLLNYNGEAHNLMQRKNRMDIQIRQQQYFDWLLMGEKPAPWIAEGIPAVMKGRTTGLQEESSGQQESGK